MSSSEWINTTLGKIAILNYGKSLVADKRKNGNIPVYSSSGLIGWHDQPLVCEEGIIVGRKGTVGTVYFSDKPFYCIDTAYFIKKSELKCDIKYLYYLLKSLGLDKLNEDSAVPGLNRDTAYSQTFRIPKSLPTQRRIADILSALDEKIELNRQTNATLEAIAQAIFREWFVEFNYPVWNYDLNDGMKTMITGGPNHSPSGNQKNQGADMVESALGPIPKGWRVGSILEIANLLSGGTPSTRVAEYWDGQIKWISAKDVSNAQGTFVLDTERKISQTGLDNSSTKLLPALTTIVTARGTVGSYCILAEPMTMNQTNYGLKAKTDNTDYFVFFSLSNLVAHLRQVSYGTIFDTVTTKTFEQSKIIIPPISEMQEFDSRIAPIMQNILNNLRQSATLAALRDALLPKLMSGEIEV